MFLGYLDKTNVPSISTVRCIQYTENTMKIFKASGIGSGLSAPYKTLNIESNMRVTSPFTVPISNQSSAAIPKRYTNVFLTLYGRMLPKGNNFAVGGYGFFKKTRPSRIDPYS